MRSPLVRKRLDGVVQAVRQGEALSPALARASGFPNAIVRLAAIGEASGALGSMLARAGRLAESEALKRIQTMGNMAGPILIVILGSAIGLLMAGLLSGISGLGDAAIGS